MIYQARHPQEWSRVKVHVPGVERPYDILSQVCPQHFDSPGFVKRRIPQNGDFSGQWDNVMIHHDLLDVSDFQSSSQNVKDSLMMFPWLSYHFHIMFIHFPMEPHVSSAEPHTQTSAPLVLPKPTPTFGANNLSFLCFFPCRNTSTSDSSRSSFTRRLSLWQIPCMQIPCKQTNSCGWCMYVCM